MIGSKNLKISETPAIQPVLSVRATLENLQPVFHPNGLSSIDHPTNGVDRIVFKSSVNACDWFLRCTHELTEES
ncbi:MAG: hypothetical protein EXS05_07555 [Planctomycetaceae bacterium]|nr:hypothetical protein [Planctomycetaceae bacterium]